jgi:hypothetical protein
MNFTTHPDFAPKQAAVRSLIENFDSGGEPIGEAVRNSIKVFDLDGIRLNIKSFKVPNLLNKIIYGYLRKSKARRSFEYADKLLQMGFGTPKPIAFAENRSAIGLLDSYYVSEQLDYDLMFRELTVNPDYPDFENILKQFAKFSFDLHEKGVEFIDNTSGNTLIKQTSPGHYDFYLVDLNRMNFGASMTLEKRLSNIAKLTNNRGVLEVIAREYARLSGESPEQLLASLIRYADGFLERFNRRRRIKQKLRFWKK